MDDHNVEEAPVLIAQGGKQDGSRWIMNRDVLLIGRGPDCDIIIPDRQVSRHHARCRKEKAGVVIEDLGSKNGTYLNGSPVREPKILQDGDIIQVALVLKLTFVGSEATVPLSITEATVMGLGQLRMDHEAHQVWVADRELDPPLSPPQYRFLELLYQNMGKVVSRDEVTAFVWPDSVREGISEQAIDALVRRLRDRLAELDPDHSYVVTVRGHGFRLDNPI